jgi:hypothetical protein
MLTTNMILSHPEYDAPLLPGEQIHIGYEPVSEDYAFEFGYKENPFYIAKTSVEIARGRMRSERIISLIRKFVWVNDANFVVPKQEYLSNPSTAKQAIYESTVLYVETDHTVRIGFAIYALRGLEDKLVIEVNRLKGNSTAFHEFYRAIKIYLESEGASHPRIQKNKLPGAFIPKTLAVGLSLGLCAQHICDIEKSAVIDIPVTMFSGEMVDPFDIV